MKNMLLQIFKQFNVGLSYESGWGVEKSLEKAFQRFLSAAETGKNNIYPLFMFLFQLTPFLL